MMPALVAGTIVLAYFIGAIPFGYAVARWRGVDIRRQGSGNIGATNVGRVLGRRFGVFVLLLDFAKGALPVAAAQWVNARVGGDAIPLLGPDGLPVLAGLSALLGHLFPVYLGFHGGKGVATGAGVVAVLLPVPALWALLTWLFVVSASGYVSLASITAAAMLAWIRLLLTPSPFAPANITLTSFSLLAAALVIVKHRANIRRLLQGTESRVGIPAMPQFLKTIHVLAVGLWFGSAVFFNLIAAPLLFQRFESLATTPSAERALLPLPPELNKEFGTRLAGAAVSPLFPAFFLLEGVCGFIVAATAWAWSRTEPLRRVHRLRSVLAILAFATVVVAWPLSQKVSQLRFERYSSDAQIAQAAKVAFGAWHAYSLLLSLLTLALVTVLMALAAQLPNGVPAATERSSAKEPEAEGTEVSTVG